MLAQIQTLSFIFLRVLLISDKNLKSLIDYLSAEYVSLTKFYFYEHLQNTRVFANLLIGMYES